MYERIFETSASVRSQWSKDSSCQNARPPEDLVSQARGIAFEPIHDPGYGDPRLDQHVNMVGHDNERAQIESVQLRGTSAQCAQDALRNRWILQPIWAMSGPVECTV